MGENPTRNKHWLDIGCGNLVHEGCVGVDIDPASKADVICDIEKWLPFQDNMFENIYCHNIVEHSKNIFPLFEEIHRVWKKWAIVEIIVPHYSSRYARWDLTHIRPFSYDSFTCYGGQIPGFKIVSVKLMYIGANNAILKYLLRIIFFVPYLLAFYMPRFFERFLCYLFGGIDYMKIMMKVTK